MSRELTRSKTRGKRAAEPAKSSVSILDVARMANVSVATVSRVMNNHNTVTEETRKTVLRAINKSGYVQPVAHKRRGRPPSRREAIPDKKVGFVFLGIDAEKLFDYPVFPTILRGAEKGLREAGIPLMVSRVEDDVSVNNFLLEEQLNGLILMGKADLSKEIQERVRSFPSVWVMTHGFPWGDHIMPDHYEIGRLAFAHLHAQGCRKLAVLNINPVHPGFKIRVESFLQAARDQSVQVTPFFGEKHYSLDILQPEVQAAEMDRIGERLVRQKAAIDGVFVVSDYQTALLYRFFYQQELRVNELFKLISSDNEERLLAGLMPRPTTIDIESEYIGWRAAQQLIMRMQYPNRENRERILIAPRLLQTDV
jgi:DNA-binding LacI/PurR family transcriptional regulator